MSHVRKAPTESKECGGKGVVEIPADAERRNGPPELIALGQPPEGTFQAWVTGRTSDGRCAVPRSGASARARSSTSNRR